ncbi:MAG: signal peptide peptidase SppA [Pseudomonadota bacterium]|nr:signal peptide peptidase SppA [Pseudomonadota bacterium]
MQFASKVWKLLVGIKDALVLLLLIGFFTVLFAALSLRPSPAKVEGGALLLQLDGVLVEEKSTPDPFQLLLAQQAPVGEYPVRDVVRALESAAKDERITAVVLDLSRFLGGGQVHERAVAAAIDKVRAAKKPVLTFANAYADDGVLLAAHASEVWVDPMGAAFVSGPGGNHLFYKNLFDRFGVKAHVYRVGTYKSAVEPYLRADMSEAAKANYQDIYGALWEGWKADLAKARPKASVAQMTQDPAAWIAAGKGDLADASKAAGLVDRIGDKSEFEQRVAKIVGEAKGKDTSDHAARYRHTALATWLTANPASTKGETIGVITVAGTIVDGDAGPGSAGGDRIARLLDDNLDKGFKALVVRVDSPGGSAMASERIRRAILRYREKKIPVVISMGNLAASGGYWVSTAGERIFAEPDTLTGSIGVFAVVTSFEKTLGDLGITSDGVKTTPLSGEPDILGGFSPEVDALLQGSVESTYAKFLGVAGKARDMTPEAVDAVGQGRVWSGREAMERGLVDEMGGLDAALAYAAKKGGVGNKAWHAEYLAEPADPFDSLLAQVLARPSGEEAAISDYAALAARVHARRMAQAGRAVEALAGTSGIQAYCLACTAVDGAVSGAPGAARSAGSGGLGGWLRLLAAGAQAGF